MQSLFSVQLFVYASSLVFYGMGVSLSIRPVNQLTKTKACEVLFDLALYKVKSKPISQRRCRANVSLRSLMF